MPIPFLQKQNGFGKYDKLYTNNLKKFQEKYKPLALSQEILKW